MTAIGRGERRELHKRHTSQVTRLFVFCLRPPGSCTSHVHPPSYSHPFFRVVFVALNNPGYAEQYTRSTCSNALYFVENISIRFNSKIYYFAPLINNKELFFKQLLHIYIALIISTYRFKAIRFKKRDTSSFTLLSFCDRSRVRRAR